MKTLPIGRSLLGIACLASVAIGSENNIETDLLVSPFIIGAPEQKNPYEAFVKTELQNQLISRGVERSDGDTLHAGGVARYYGLGIKLDGYFAVVADSRSAEVSTGEFIQLDARADYLLQVEWREGIKMLTIDPYLELNTYPNEPSDIVVNGVVTGRNVLKNNQQWLGVDAWVSPPFQGFEGIEFGGGIAQGIGADFNAFRGALGSRQHFQFDPNLDLSLHELINFGNRQFNQLFVGTDRQGITNLGIGGKLTMPLPYQEWWGFIRSEWIYQLNGENIDALKANGQSTGELLMSFGIEWRP